MAFSCCFAIRIVSVFCFERVSRAADDGSKNDREREGSMINQPNQEELQHKKQKWEPRGSRLRSGDEHKPVQKVKYEVKYGGKVETQ